MNLGKLTQMTEDETREYIEKIRWTNGTTCPHCQSKKVWSLNGKSHRKGLYKCATCRKQFTVTVGTIMEDSHLSLKKWILAFYLVCSSKKGISALQLKRNLGLGSYKTAWHLAHRIRKAMENKSFKAALNGIVEVDETYVGGKSRMGIRGRGSERKTPVLAMVERGGNVVARPIEHVDSKTLHSAIKETVAASARIMTDEWAAYRGIGKSFSGGHCIIKHWMKEFARGDVTTNTAESFFALLKRGIHGIFHHVSKKHLFRYCNEFSFRWDFRKVADGERTNFAIRGIEGKRLMYCEL